MFGVGTGTSDLERLCDCYRRPLPRVLEPRGPSPGPSRWSTRLARGRPWRERSHGQVVKQPRCSRAELGTPLALGSYFGLARSWVCCHL